MPSSNRLDEANSSSGATIAFVVASLEHLSGGIEYPDRIRKRFEAGCAAESMGREEFFKVWIGPNAFYRLIENSAWK
ncbi:hypothetical protein YC2023_052451 [Brassica napus]